MNFIAGKVSADVKLDVAGKVATKDYQAAIAANPCGAGLAAESLNQLVRNLAGW